MKSECSSANRACFCRAASSRSAGRSRGSGIDSAAASTSTSRTHPSASACRIIRPMRGSSGSCASRRPRSVIAPSASKAPSSCSSCTPSRMLRCVRRVQEREVLDVAELQRRHLQDHRGEVGPQNLRVGVARPRLEVLLRVQPDAHARRDASRPAGPLRGRRLRDRLDGQPLHLGPAAVAGDAGGARVDDVADAWHGQRRLGDVGGQARPVGRVCGAKTFCCSAVGSRAYSGSTSVWSQRTRAMPQRCRGSRVRRTGTPARHRAARPPVRRRRRRSPRSGRAPRCGRSRGRGRRDRHRRRRIAAPRLPVAGTGSRRDRCARTPRRSAHPPKCAANRPGSIVADVTITFRSGLRGNSSRR